MSALDIPVSLHPGGKMRWMLAALAFAGAAPCSLSNAQTTATSIPLGIYTVKIAGKQAGESQARTYFGAQLLPDKRFQGLVAAINGSSVRFSNADHAGLNLPGRKQYLHVLTGSGRGFIADIEEFRTSDLRVAENLPDWIQPGDQVLIRPHPRVIDLFGADNRFGLASGAGAGAADNVVAWDPQMQAEKVYYFHSTRNRWEQEGIEADAGETILRFPNGLYIIRRSSGSLRIALSGEIGAEPLLLPVRTGTNVFSIPVNLTGALGDLIASSGDHPVLGGLNSSEADLLTFEESSTGNQRGPFYHSVKAGATEWRKVGEDGASQALDFLSTLVLRRTGPPGYVRAEGNLSPTSTPAVLPADPEAGETPLTGVLYKPSFWHSLSSSAVLQVETSIDLQSWSATPALEDFSDRVTFNLPAGQSRAFYRLKLTLNSD